MLEVKDLSVSYGTQDVVHGVSLVVPKGNIISLIGANGAGKTSTLRAIVGLTRPKSGSVMLEGERIDQKPCGEIVRRGIALSPEGRRVFSGMSVHENLLSGAFLQKDRDRIANTLERIYTYFPRLLERQSQLAGSLSGGEQQMVAIGRALMAQPKVLLLDEPSLGLAPLVVKEIVRILEQISREEGISVVLVEQNANMALKLCDSAYVMESGRITLTGTGVELLRSDYVRKAYLGI